MVEATDGETVTPRKVAISVVADRAEAVKKIMTLHDPATVYVQSAERRCMDLYARVLHAMNSTSDEEFFPLLVELTRACLALEPLTPLLPDGSLNFPKAVVSSTIGPVAASVLVDGNTDTFAGFYLVPDRYMDFDFGPDFKFSASAFGIGGRVNFEDRMERVKLYGSNDRRHWTELTPEPTQRTQDLATIKVADQLAEEPFRFLRVQKNSGGLLELSEMRIYGRRHESGNRIESVTLSSEKNDGVRVAFGETVRVNIQGREPLDDVRVRIQGVDATVKRTGDTSYIAEAVMRPPQAWSGPLEFSVDYRRQDGKPGDPVSVTTDGSSLRVVDESRLIRDVPKIAQIIDPSTGHVASQSRRLLGALFDGNPGTFSEFTVNSLGTGAFLLFDFGKENAFAFRAWSFWLAPDTRIESLALWSRDQTMGRTGRH